MNIQDNRHPQLADFSAKMVRLQLTKGEVTAFVAQTRINEKEVKSCLLIGENLKIVTIPPDFVINSVTLV